MTSTADGAGSRDEAVAASTGDAEVDAALAPLAGLAPDASPQQLATALEGVLTALRQRLGAAEA